MSNGADTQGQTVPAAAAPRRGWTFWAGLVLLALGVVLAVMGVRAAAASNTRGEDLKRYAHASIDAQNAVSIAADALAAGAKLQALDTSEAKTAPDLRQLLIAGNSSEFNRRNDAIDATGARRQTLRAHLATLSEQLHQALSTGVSETSTSAVRPRDS
jgi:hypothetical protein